MTTENKYPVKECDYCDHVGMAFTFMNGETICEKCHSDLPFDSTECRKLIVKQRKRITELESENSNLAVRCNKFNDQLNEALLDADKERLRAEAAEKRLAEVERERDKLRCAVATAIDVFDDYDMDVETYAPIKHVKMKQGLHDSLNKFAIKQQIKAVEYCYKNIPDLADSDYVKLKRRAEELRQQLNGGE